MIIFKRGDNDEAKLQAVEVLKKWDEIIYKYSEKMPPLEEIDFLVSTAGNQFLLTLSTLVTMKKNKSKIMEVIDLKESLEELKRQTLKNIQEMIDEL